LASSARPAAGLSLLADAAATGRKPERTELDAVGLLSTSSTPWSAHWPGLEVARGPPLSTLDAYFATGCVVTETARKPRYGP